MKYAISILILITSCFSIFAQNNTLHDDFIDNSNQWYSISKNQIIELQNGYLHVLGIGENDIVEEGIILPFDINYYNDFTVESKMSLVSGRTGNGLIWNFKDKRNYCRFLITDRDGEYAAYQYIDGYKNTLISWSSSSSINQNYKSNVLKIEKNENKTNFYINDEKVSSINLNYSGSQAGIFFGGDDNTELKVDYFSINCSQNQPISTDDIPPLIIITYPNVSRGFKPVEQQNKVTITGKATDTSGIFEILINNEPASVDAQGNFSKTVLLAFGDNSFTVKATDIKQNTATEIFVIERKSNQDVVVNNPINYSNSQQTGKYYALIIGNNIYNDPAINSLDEPINDASKLYTVLTTEYTFEPQNVTFLKNATYVQMIEAFDNLSNKITENDNLLVFYAGHGWWDEDKELGYWLPTDAKQKSTAFWIANSRISDYMSSTKTKHTLLIADACFSGSIFKTRAAFSDAGQAINSLYELPSRTAMTSGNLKEVPDKSVFLEFLVKRLDQNTEKYLSADQLFASFRIAVMNNSKTEPRFGTIQNAGDEGGEFIFIRR